MNNKNMLSAYFDAFRNFAIFEGRTNRFNYWSFLLINMFVVLALSTFPKIAATYNFLIIFPSLAITVRRLHDINKSGWFISPLYIVAGIAVIIGLVAMSDPYGFTVTYSQSLALKIIFTIIGLFFVAWAIYVIVLTCFKGTAEENRFGTVENSECEEKAAVKVIYSYFITIAILLAIAIGGAIAANKSMANRLSYYGGGYGSSYSGYGY